MDKQLLEKFDEGIATGQRIADALDKLVNEPLVEIRTPPPQCPHCGQINPTVRVYQSPEGKGSMEGYIIPGQCTHCEREIYCVCVELSVQPDESSARMVGNEVRERMNNG